jgi:hypothetical protein
VDRAARHAHGLPSIADGPNATAERHSVARAGRPPAATHRGNPPSGCVRLRDHLRGLRRADTVRRC